MQGKNTIVFNQATMMTAIQHYLNTVVFRQDATVKVTNVKYNKANNYTEDFSIDIERDADAKDAPFVLEE